MSNLRKKPIAVNMAIENPMNLPKFSEAVKTLRAVISNPAICLIGEQARKNGQKYSDAKPVEFYNRVHELEIEAYTHIFALERLVEKMEEAYRK